MSRLFVTSSGTEIGKTFVTCALVHQLRAAGRSVAALKPVASGFDEQAVAASDTCELLSALDRPPNVENIDAISPWRFAEPLSPDMAAAREGRAIPFDELVAFCEERSKDGITLIEGIGGVMVPLDKTHTVLDWIAALETPVLLIVGGYLGTLSHTLTAHEALRARGLNLAGIVVDESPEQPVPLEETAAAIRRFVEATPVVTLPRLSNYREAPNLLPLVEPLL
ncbi:MAG TPA: dethiobiotin synthase [Gammaproteobacteria bacterium]